MAGPVTAQAFASGMAAISAVFWTFTGAGTHVVAPAAVYGGTYGFLRHVAARFGVRADFVDMTDPDQVRAAMRPETRIVYAETLANPTTAVADLPVLAGIAHRQGALLVVDSTMAPPVVCRPWSTARTSCCIRRRSTWAGTRTRLAGWCPGRPA